MKKKPIFTSLALLLAAGMPAMAVSPRALSQFVNLELVHSKTTVGTIIQSISQQTGYEFSYDVSILNKEISDVSVNVKNERIENVLDQVFNGTGISYRIVNNRIFLKDNGYNNYLMIGSDSEFGGRKAYFSTHGYEISDYYTNSLKKLQELLWMPPVCRLSAPT